MHHSWHEKAIKIKKPYFFRVNIQDDLIMNPLIRFFLSSTTPNHNPIKYIKIGVCKMWGINTFVVQRFKEDGWFPGKNFALRSCLT